MNAKANELLRDGDLEGALRELQAQVRANPSRVADRVFLFQLLSVLGDWDRAATQLEVIEGLDRKTWPLVHTYRDAINGERHRAAVFRGSSRPLVFGEPSEWMAVLVEAQQMAAQGKGEAFLELNARALELAPARGGKINDEPFEWLADSDQRFGPMLEIIFNGHYYWTALDNIRTLRTEEPADLRDLVWLPAELTWINGGQNMVLVPARYPLLEGAPDACLLSRRTDWQESAPGVYEGLGQRMMTTDRSEYALLQIRSVEMDG